MRFIKAHIDGYGKFHNMAFIKEYAGRVGTLPLIVDDILVNFDPQRAKTTIRLLNEISGENQSIMFTCHPNTLDLC